MPFFKRTKILGTACEFRLSLISLALSECMSHLGLNTNINEQKNMIALPAPHDRGAGNDATLLGLAVHHLGSVMHNNSVATWMIDKGYSCFPGIQAILEPQDFIAYHSA